ncbi:hypothetical protein Poli38472_006665 [Pythium oligandrum]|uniref:Uncharacterized protein n=1 Tax=Pythium oligandrum TaxID=41045 RepID=A0A8K1FAX0_PYTOL|nr:hypothetical protein Poli38472_006665 [Pythium oligandrum]|eukprot:TMW56655.1 hypothetical protein Poli38472_006665 [Pythium oligandrum]
MPTMNHNVGLAGATMDEMEDFLSALNRTDQDNAEAERAEKRRKHREAMVQFRLRKKTNFADMKKQEHSLQDVLQGKLKQYRDRVKTEDAVESSMKAFDQLLDDFADVVATKESLLRENRGMETVIGDLRKFQRLVEDEMGRVAEEIDGEETKSSSPVKALASDGFWVQFLENEPAMYYEMESAAMCASRRADGFQRAHSLRAAFLSDQFDPTVTECFGWRAQRSLDWTNDHQSIVRFRFTRRVPRSRTSVDALQRGTWHIISSPELNDSLYSSRVEMKILQTVDENSFISLRNSPHRDNSLHWRYFCFHSRMEYVDEQNHRSVLIAMTVMDKQNPVMRMAESMDTQTDPTVWIKDGQLVLKFTEIPEDDEVEIEYSGYMQCINEGQARFLMVETCTMLMRWENRIVPPRLLAFV